MSTILITGASRGIGALLARRLAEAGHHVFAGMRDPDANPPDRMPLGAGRVDRLRLDVDDPEAAIRAVDYVVEHAGRLDVLVNNAGVAWLTPLELQSESLLRATMETNFFGALRMIRAALPVMRKQRSGQVLNVSSLAAFHGLPAEAAYCASKSAIDAASQSLALEVERFGIRVTSIRPGYTAAGLLRSEVACDVERGSEYEPLLEHLLALYERSAQSAESPERVVEAVIDTIENDSPPPRIELGELAAAVAVVRKGSPREQLDAMRTVHALEWWRAGAPRPGEDTSR